MTDMLLREGKIATMSELQAAFENILEFLNVWLRMMVYIYHQI